MDVLHHSRAVVLGAFCAFAVACVSRSAPQQFPAASAASPHAKAAPDVVVTRALDGDPPLPGEDASGWPGLARKAGKTSAHGAHHHDH